MSSWGSNDTNHLAHRRRTSTLRVPPAKHLIVWTENGSQVLPGLCMKHGLASVCKLTPPDGFVAAKKRRRQRSTRRKIASSLSACGGKKSWGDGAPELQQDTNFSTKKPALQTTGNNLGPFGWPLTSRHLIHHSIVFRWLPDTPRKQQKAHLELPQKLADSRLHTSQLTSLLKASATLCALPSWVQRPKAAKGFQQHLC